VNADVREHELAKRLGLPRVVWFSEVGSTLDVAHRLAEEGASPGTLVVADAQTAGRGRFGRSWRSDPNAGIWITMIERPTDVSALEVLPLRVGLAIARALGEFSRAPVQVKWPNDIYVEGKKIAGILVEARWRDGAPAWIAVGVGINLRPPVDEPRGGGLGDSVTREAVLDRLIPVIRAASLRGGLLDAEEVRALNERHAPNGRECSQPLAGRIVGIEATGALVIETGASTVIARNGSLVLKEDL
jgi:BirA family biotin operon repressor/biotin-[acetyl-CoA-carboxylase] ligase